MLSSSEDPKFYTGFLDYPIVIKFWKYVEPSASNLTYFSYVHDNCDSINFPILEVNKRSFPGAMFLLLGVEGNHSQLTNYSYF